MKYLLTCSTFNIPHFLHCVHSYTCVGACAAVAATTFLHTFFKSRTEGTRVLFSKMAWFEARKVAWCVQLKYPTWPKQSSSSSILPNQNCTTLVRPKIYLKKHSTLQIQWCTDLVDTDLVENFDLIYNLKNCCDQFVVLLPCKNSI